MPRADMSEQNSLTPFQADYDAIEAAVMETARGRWFLAEFAGRNRTADTRILLDAIAKLERAIPPRPAPDREDRTADTADLAPVFERLAADLAALAPNPMEGSARESNLEGLVHAQEATTSDILDATEFIQEAAWTLRESGADHRICDALDQQATQIYAACATQDVVAKRVRKAIHALKVIEQRVLRTVAAARVRDAGHGGPSSIRTPPTLNLTTFGNDIDFVVVDDPGTARATETSNASPDTARGLGVTDVLLDQTHGPEGASYPRSLAELDALDTTTKLRLFT